MFVLTCQYGYAGTFITREHVDLVQKYYKSHTFTVLEVDVNEKSDTVYVITLNDNYPYLVTDDKEKAIKVQKELIDMEQTFDHDIEYCKKPIGLCDRAKLFLNIKPRTEEEMTKINNRIDQLHSEFEAQNKGINMFLAEDENENVNENENTNVNTNENENTNENTNENVNENVNENENENTDNSTEVDNTDYTIIDIDVNYNNQNVHEQDTESEMYKSATSNDSYKSASCE